MNKGSKRLGVLATAGVLTIAGVTASWAADAKAGKAIYDKRCASCHAADGKGNPAMAKTMKGLDIVNKETQGKKDDQLAKVIAEGEGKMPAYKDLSKQEQADVVAYIRSLAK
jgi:mono/diheme cytochrome c family protein